MNKKVYVDVKAEFSSEGKIIPIEIIWEDGTVYTIDKILDVRRAASLKAGGLGIRYTCLISNQTTYIFLDDNRWFVERK